MHIPCISHYIQICFPKVFTFGDRLTDIGVPLFLSPIGKLGLMSHDDIHVFFISKNIPIVLFHENITR